MSTQIAELESINEGRKLYVTQYFGGKKQGLCLQLTPSYGEHYVQLNKKQTQALVRELQNWLGENELFQKQMDEKSEIRTNAITGKQTMVFSDDY